MKIKLISLAAFFLAFFSVGVKAQCVCNVEEAGYTEFEVMLTDLIETQDNAEALRFLERGDPDKKNACGYGLLLVAAGINDVHLVEELVSRGADLDASNYEGVTPLFMAAGSYNNEVLKIIIEAGANPDVQLKDCVADNFESTPLLKAAVADNLEGAGILLENGADFSVSSSNGANLYDVLLMKGYDTNRMLDLIKLVPQENREEAKNELVFSLAMKGSKVSELREVLSLPHDPNFSMEVNTPYSTPLLIAAVAGNFDGVEALIEYGADIDYATPDGRSLEDVVFEREIEELYYLFPLHESER